ncbi:MULTISPECIES: Arc family DNA-binding protein [unclassified Mesorhizobium]|uniref:FitA-like ribbon-helix-helix domain-containing protein n=1 Tax=unclassified Mesorhizobium TaxID=325217 RepID=UPI0011291425|nr:MULTISPECIES: Arc family DNA-binding protein [unclassified Mesorhizobium]TPM06797.1 Arc family DNA-binding protein [Mesorhizobium sp. B2-3-8]TPM15320.1 Arc family DNA-binding protein [Mesorhizobium sp. B2-3-7]
MTNRLDSHVRLTPALKKRLKVAAAENGRSLNEEIVTRLESSFELTNDVRGKVKDLLGQAIAELVEG